MRPPKRADAGDRSSTSNNQRGVLSVYTPNKRRDGQKASTKEKQAGKQKKTLDDSAAGVDVRPSRGAVVADELIVGGDGAAGFMELETEGGRRITTPAAAEGAKANRRSDDEEDGNDAGNDEEAEEDEDGDDLGLERAKPVEDIRPLIRLFRRSVVTPGMVVVGAEDVVVRIRGGEVCDGFGIFLANRTPVAADTINFDGTRSVDEAGPDIRCQNSAVLVDAALLIRFSRGPFDKARSRPVNPTPVAGFVFTVFKKTDEARGILQIKEITDPGEFLQISQRCDSPAFGTAHIRLAADKSRADV